MPSSSAAKARATSTSPSATNPREGEVALPIPEAARAAAGLDAFPQWLLVSRCNRTDWPDGVRMVLGKASPLYGTLPAELVNLFRTQVAEVARRKLLQGRDRLPE